MILQLSTKWYGLDTLAREEFEALRKPTEVAITKATLYYESKVKQKLRGPRTGRWYGDHQASAPGEPPAANTGGLRQSITHTPVIWVGDVASAEVGSVHPAANILEWGGIGGNGSRILPRPYMSATWLEEEERIQKMLDNAVRKAPVMGDIIPEVVA